MEVVEGSTVEDHYWTISYSWNQSGEIIDNDDGDYIRIDECEHEIITYEPGPDGAYDWMTIKTVDPDTADNQHVSFEQLIQKICLDFGVQYIWYDQMCINQDDHDAKIHEIKQMHHIYKNSRCTIALVPELEFAGGTDEAGLDDTDLNIIPESQWSRRIWTLEEAYMSNTILFLGRNVHLWSSDLDIDGSAVTDHFLKNIQSKTDHKWLASTTLWYARTRTSTKAHDRVFALINIFPELKDGINFSYRQPLMDLMVEFYELLAQNDLSILLYGAANYIESDEEIAANRREEASLLPSWTGSAGLHLSQDQLKMELINTTIAEYSVSEKCMTICSEFIPIRIEAFDSVEQHEPVEGPYRGYTVDGLPWILCDAETGENVSSEEELLTFVAIPSESQGYYPNYIKHNGLTTTHFLPVKDGDEDWINTLSKPTLIGGVLSLVKECTDECFILTEIMFPLANELFLFYPVIGKFEDHYESIGACFLLDELTFESFVDHDQQEFNIE